MGLAVGTKTRYQGANGTVVAVTDTLTSGRFSLTYGGNTFQGRVLKCSNSGATEYPLSTNGADPDLRVGLVLKDGSDPNLFAIWFSDLPAPLGWGDWVQGAGGDFAEASSYSGQDSIILTVGYRLGPITLQIGGVAAGNGAYVDLMLYYQTPEGTCRAWYQPAYPYNGLVVTAGVPLRDSTADLGMFVTSGGAGRVSYRHPDGTLEDQIILPRGIGALGNRAADRWPSGPEPSRYLTSVEGWALQEHVDLSEGAAVTLNVASGVLTVTGPAGGNCVLQWEGAGTFPRGTVSTTIGGGGSVTITGLPPGKYIGSLFHPTDVMQGTGRQSATIVDSGGTATMAFSAWTVVPEYRIQGIIYLYDAVPAAGVTVWALLNIGDPSTAWIALATTDANGAFGPVDPGSAVRYIAWDDTYGAVSCDSGPGWWDPVMGTRIGSAWVSDSEVYPEGVTPWAAAMTEQRHPNLPVDSHYGYLQNTTTGAKYWFNTPGAGQGTVSEPFPVWRLNPDFTIPAAPYSYDLYDADGTYISGAGGAIIDRLTPRWASEIVGWWSGLHVGGQLSGILGGKYNGPVIEYSPQTLTEDVLREAQRVGLETGVYRQPLDHISHSEAVQTAAGEAGITYYRAWTVSDWECPYCGGPVAGFRALGLAYTRRYCQQCADFGISTDCRGSFSTQTLAALTDWFDTTAKQTGRGAWVSKRIPGWPRPEEYAESDAYKINDWEGLGIPRWASVHLVLGTLAGGAFTDGESIADAEARLGRTVGPCQLKLVLTTQYVGSGKTVSVTATRADNGQSHVLTGTVPAGAQVGDIVLLSPCPHHEYPKPTSWFTDVTAAAEVSGDGYLACQIVNDGPAWRSSSGVIVTHQAYAPYACDVLLQEWEPECRTDYMGRAHVVYNRDGGLYHRIWQVGQEAWGEAICLTQRANWITACQHHAFEIVGPVLLVTCESGGQRVWFRSTDSYGETWTYRSGNVAFSGLTNVQTTVDYLGRVWGVGLDSNSLLTAECTPDLGVTGYYRNAVDPSAADSEQPGLCIAGSTFILVTSQGGSLRTWVSKRGGAHWEQAPVVE